MPTISMFYGIIISLFFEIREKHYSPHIQIIGDRPRLIFDRMALHCRP